MLTSTPRPILAFMQCQWFNNPDKVRANLARYADDPERQHQLRRRMIEYALFAGCKSGRVLKKVFGDLCDQITWEEASKEIGGHASAVFPADLAHMRTTFAECEPRAVIAFGKIAGDALRIIEKEMDLAPTMFAYAPHPAARHSTVMVELHHVATMVRSRVAPETMEIVEL